jgi:hypothetical protein
LRSFFQIGSMKVRHFGAQSRVYHKFNLNQLKIT